MSGMRSRSGCPVTSSAFGTASAACPRSMLNAVPWPLVSVALRVRVSADAMRLLGVDRGVPNSTQDIFTTGHRLKMGRVNAQPITAKVIQRHSVGDVPVGEAMSRRRTHGGIAELAVPARKLRALPDPALPKGGSLRWNGAVLIDLCPKQNIRRGTLRGHLDLLNRGVVGQAVSAALPFNCTSAVAA